ncbi:MAG: hypothetical protein D6731_09210 [Planctomycetota bacterium]|nr:MAG: hypothetical protein D6731_09210 [Planctomycetota bacterium]
MGEAADFKAKTRELKRRIMEEAEPKGTEPEAETVYPECDSNDWGWTESEEKRRAAARSAASIEASEEELSAIDLDDPELDDLDDLDDLDEPDGGVAESVEEELEEVDLDDLESAEEEYEALEELTSSEEALLAELRSEEAEPASELTWPDELTPLDDGLRAGGSTSRRRVDGGGQGGAPAGPTGGAPVPCADASAPAAATEAVRRELASKARDTTLLQLAKQGLNNVKVLGLNTVEKIVADAVATSLERFAVEQTEAQRRALELEARREFTKLLRRHKQSRRERSELAREVEGLREELERAQQALAHEQRGSAQLTPEAVVALEESFRRLLGEFLDEERRTLLAEDHPQALCGLSELERKLGEVFDRLLDRVRSKNEELLQLRIGKLNAALEETEAALRALAQSKGFDDGIASIYDRVQGLSPEDSHYARKKDLLAIVFVENLRIQQREVTAEDREAYADALAALGTPEDPRPAVGEVPAGFAAPADLSELPDDVAF